MYLSRLLLAGEQFRNPYEIHRALWSVFPDAPAQERDFLFRVEEHSTRQTQVLMQSQRQPGRNTSFARVFASKSFELTITEGRQLHFLLVANPVKTITDEQGRLDSKGEIKKCRVPLISEEEQAAWLKRKLNGAALLGMVEIDNQLPLHFRKGSRPGKIQPYVFKGILETQNTAKLRSILQQGIGPAKAFGCGMLSLAAASC